MGSCQNYNNTVYKNPYERAAAAHIEFERIHPFSDGNGRTGRLLINFEMLKHDLAPIVIPVEQRTDYFAMLSKKDIGKLTVFLHDLSNQELERINTCKSISVDRMTDQLNEAKKKADEHNKENTISASKNEPER